MARHEGLLKAIGGECAGALAVEPEQPVDLPSGYREISPKDLQGLAEAASALSLYAGEAGVRLSLAGAQDKLPVYVEEGRFHLPVGTSPSSHILKFPAKSFAHLAANEVFVSLLAHELRLPAAKASLVRLRRATLCLVERYDRVRNDAGQLIRLHQEDLCQALGASPHRKYETEGGPSFASCHEVVSRNSAEPILDSEAMLRWLAFNVLIGNADAHAKNISLLHRRGGVVKLAPFYDLLCTRAYKLLDRRLAMAVGDSSDSGAIRGADWRALADRIGVKPSFVIETVKEMAGSIAEALKRAGQKFRERYGDSPALQMIAPGVRRQARRTSALLGQ